MSGYRHSGWARYPEFSEETEDDAEDLTEEQWVLVNKILRARKRYEFAKIRFTHPSHYYNYYHQQLDWMRHNTPR